MFKNKLKHYRIDWKLNENKMNDEEKKIDINTNSYHYFDMHIHDFFFSLNFVDNNPNQRSKNR